MDRGVVLWMGIATFGLLLALGLSIRALAVDRQRNGQTEVTLASFATRCGLAGMFAGFANHMAERYLLPAGELVALRLLDGALLGALLSILMEVTTRRARARRQ